jgi:hypothetical protein
MQKHILLLMFIHTFACNVYTQSWNKSGSCHINVNNGAKWTDSENKKDIIDAEFKIIYMNDKNKPTGWCSGTLINRNTNNGTLGYYFITARHCMQGENLNAKHTLCFNYQSPNDDNNSTPESNRGKIPVDTSYEYLHKTKLKLVNSFYWGDFALCEIETPIPPHFNVYYAGWTPNLFSSPSLCNTPNSYIAIHHPAGDIKKISGTNALLKLETPVATGCYTITKIIDVLFGWIWGHKISTQVICNYVDIPWCTAPYWCHGGVEGGSSGSGLFNSSNRQMGILSGALFECGTVAPTTFGKFKSNYYNASIKNTLNPSNNVWVDLVGMGGRRITCYDNLVLPGASNGEYYPAKHYKGDNTITLQANNTIIANANLRIHNEAVYYFKAGNSINLKPGFKVEAGAHFNAKIESCQSRASNESDESAAIQQHFIEYMSQINVPAYQPFNLVNFMKQEENAVVTHSQNAALKLYGNSSDGLFEIEILSVENEKEYTIMITDLLGKKVYAKNFHNNPSTYRLNLNLQGYPDGMYFINVIGNGINLSEKLVINK